MDAKEIIERMKAFGLKGVRDESTHIFIKPDLLAEFVASEVKAERERCAKVCDMQSFRFATSDADDKRCYAARECALSIRAMKD